MRKRGRSLVIAWRCQAKTVDKLWRILVGHAGSRQPEEAKEPKQQVAKAA